MKVIYGTNQRLASIAIRVLTFGKYSHCGVVQNDNVIHSMGNGVTAWSLPAFKEHFPIFEIVDIPLPNEAAASSFLNDQMGKPYDYTALFKLLTHRDWKENDKWFCSELVEAMAIAGGKQRFRDAVYRITPQQSWSVI